MTSIARLVLCAAAAAGMALQAGPAGARDDAAPLRLGIIGLDTSHVAVFTRALNDAASRDHVAGARVVAAYRGGSPDIEASASRLEGFTTELRDRWGVEIVPDIASLCARVDGVLLESVDGRTHLEQVRPVLEAGKRVFIDKPLAASYDDARTIARLARQRGVAWFSSSSLRFGAVQQLASDPRLGTVLGAQVHAPAPLEPHHPDLFWYGIHGVEVLYTVMGPGCESVMRMHTPGADVVVGRWRDGRIGTFRGIRDGKAGYGVTVFGRDSIQSLASIPVPYRALLEEIVKFFRTGVPPVDPSHTLEICAFMEAADRSKASGGAETALPARGE